MIHSLKIKLAMFSALGMLMIASASAWLIWHSLVKANYQTLDSRLRLPGRRLTERTSWDTRWDRFDRSLRLVFGDTRQQDRIIRVVGHGNGYPVYYESDNWPEDMRVQHPEPDIIPEKPMRDEFYPVREPMLYTVQTFDGSHWRMANLANSDLTIHIGQRLESLRRAHRRLAAKLVLAMVVAPLLVFGFTWWIARRSLRPVEVIAATAKTLSAKDLQHRIPMPGNADVEFQSLIKVFNEMIDRLERSFTQATRFSADASHELRTPITNLYAEVSTLLNQADAQSAQHRALASMLEELERLRSVLSGLLLLSKADTNQLERSSDRIDYSELVRQLCEDYALLAEEAGLALTWEIAENLMVNGDAVLLAQAIHNLMRNAIQYNCAGGRVKVIVQDDNSEVLTRIINTGAPIEGESQQRIFERFGTAPKDEDRSGYGIGLNIVVEILRAHGGKIYLESSNTDRTIFSLRLPSIL